VLVRDLEEYYLKIMDHVNVEVFYKVIDRCLFCEAEDCLSKGEWCVIPRDSVMNGREIIHESLRQYFIAQQSIKKWWKYIDRFDKDCSITKGHKECSEEVMKDLGLDVVVIKEKITEQIRLATTGDNWHVMRGWLELAARGNIIFYPDVSINSINYQGELVASNIFEMLCNSLYEEPAACNKDPPGPGPLVIPEGSLVPTILLILVLMTVGFFVLLIIYRRVTRK